MESAVATANKLGATKVTGKCIMKNPINGKEIIISEDTVEVHVVRLLNIEIKTPLIRIRSGAVMPAFIWGNQVQNFGNLVVNFPLFFQELRTYRQWCWVH